MPLSNRRRAQRQAAANRAARRAQQIPQNDAQNGAIENRRQERNQQRRFVNSNLEFKSYKLYTLTITRLDHILLRNTI